MNLDYLIDILKKGYSYEMLTDEGEPYVVLQAPNKYMITAGMIITKLLEDNIKLLQDVQQWQGIAVEAHTDNDRLMTKLTELQNALDSERGEGGNPEEISLRPGTQFDADSDRGPLQ